MKNDPKGSLSFLRRMVLNRFAIQEPANVRIHPNKPSKQKDRPKGGLFVCGEWGIRRDQNSSLNEVTVSSVKPGWRLEAYPSFYSGKPWYF